MQTMNWFAAYTRQKHEKKVQKHAEVQEIETFLPLYHTVHRWRNGVTKELTLPLFPGYIFVRFDFNKRVQVLRVPGILHLVGLGSNSTPLADAQIEQLKTLVSTKKVEPHPFIKTGDRVQIKFGPLSGIEGIVVRKKGTWRFIISVDFIQRSVSLEIPAADVEQIPTIPTLLELRLL